MDFQKTSDEELVILVQKDNNKAFEELINRYEKPLLRYSLRLIKDYDAVEDIVQDTFISVYKNINSFDPKRKFSSWIYRITHNKTVNEIRKHSRISNLNEEIKIENENNEHKKTEKKLDEKNISKTIQKEIDKLSLKYKEVIILRYMQEKSYEEISDILQIPRNTVGTRMKRGLERLRNEMNINIEDYL